MYVVLDTNVLFSALIKDSITRKLILDYDEVFLFPDYIFDELEKHKDEIVQKSMMSTTQFDDLLGLVLKKVGRVSF